MMLGIDEQLAAAFAEFFSPTKSADGDAANYMVNVKPLEADCSHQKSRRFGRHPE